MACSKPSCAAKSTLCGNLVLVKLKTRQGLSLDDRADEEIWEYMSAKRQKTIKAECDVRPQMFYLEGGGQVSMKTVSSTRTLLTRDYPEIAEFDGSKKLGLKLIPKEFIPKYYIDLFPEDLSKAKKVLATEQKFGNEHQNALKSASRIFNEMEIKKKGEYPERVAYEVIKEVFSDTFATLVIHSLEIMIFKVKGQHQEFDFLIVDLGTATIFVIEVKQTLNHESARKAVKQLQIALQLLENYFGADICQDWSFKPVILCFKLQDDLKPLCDDCNIIVARDRRDLFDKLSQYVTFNQVQSSRRFDEDFKLMSRYLIFGITVRSLPTTAKFPTEVTKYMEGVGSWESILLWCFLTPGQMELLSKKKVVFFSGWGGGKTIAGIEVCKIWSKYQNVLILVNGFDTHDQTMLLVYSLKSVLKDFVNIHVKQIDIDKDPVKYLLKVVEGYACVFLDEMPGDSETLKSVAFKEKLQAMTNGKSYVWIALSNFDKHHIGVADAEALETTFQGFEVVTSLNMNMRNPLHIKEKVSKSIWKQEGTSNIRTETANELYCRMGSPTNLILGTTQEDPHSVLERVFIDKTMKAIVTSSLPENALVMNELLKFAFRCSNTFALPQNSNSEMGNKEVVRWLQWTPARKASSNILVTFNKMINGFDVETVICVDDIGDEKYLGDVASRTTSQFIFWQAFNTFLIESNCLPIKEGCLAMYGKVHNSEYLFNLIWEGNPDPQMSKDEFIKTLQKPSLKYESGVMDILFKATIHLHLCFKLVASDPKSSRLKTLNLCSSHANGCSKNILLTCSASLDFMLLMNGKENSHQRFLDSPDLSWCLSQMQSMHYGYSVLPRTDKDELVVIVNDGQPLVEAIRQNIKEDTCVVFYVDFYTRQFCKVLLRYLESFGDLQAEVFDDDDEQLQNYLKTKIGRSHLLVVDLKKWSDIYQHLPSECQSFITYLKCPLVAWADTKILKIMEANPKLYEVCFQGKSLIQDDPLNIVAIFNNVLSKNGYQVRSKFFLEFDCFEDNFDLSIMPLINELSDVNECNKAELMAHSKEFWDSFQEDMLDFQRRMMLVQELLQNVSNLLQKPYNLIALKNNQLKLTSSQFIKPVCIGNSRTQDWCDSDSNVVHILYVYDKWCYRNGFFVLDKLDTYQRSIMCILKSKLFTNPFSRKNTSRT